MSATTRPVLLDAVSADGRHRRPDVVAVEAPLEIQLAGPGEEPQALAVVLRTPGDDLHLALGFVLSEGVISDREEVLTASHCSGPGGIQPNVVLLRLRRPAGSLGPARLVHAGCGLCGRSSLPAPGEPPGRRESRPTGRRAVVGDLGRPMPAAGEPPLGRAPAADRRALEDRGAGPTRTADTPTTGALDDPAHLQPADRIGHSSEAEVDDRRRGPRPLGGTAPDWHPTGRHPAAPASGDAAPGEPDSGGGAGWRVPLAVVLGAPESLRRRQGVFRATGGSHGAALLEADGRVVRTAEDVGRHNALDKLIGWSAALGRWPLTTCVLALSGRVGYELVHKATIAGIPVIVGVSAPSSGAIELAAEAGVTLVGFTRTTRANIYTHPERVI